MTGSIKVNSQGICVILVAVLVFALVYFYYPYQEEDIALLRNNADPDAEGPPKDTMEALLETSGWDEVKTKLLVDPTLSVKEGSIQVEGHEVYFREGVSADVSRGNLLFLHGAAFNSKTWEDLGTLHFMAAAGFRPIAIDLPGGKGQTKSFQMDESSFLLAVKKLLGLRDTPVVIISPSMSGGWAIPFLFSHPEAFKGYVPVAPVGTGTHSQAEYQKVTVPTCIVYGEKDTGLGGKSLKDLQDIPGSEVHQLKEAGHAAYLNAPKDFHKILLAFTKRVYT